jgi:hypothetical protein
MHFPNKHQKVSLHKSHRDTKRENISDLIMGKERMKMTYAQQEIEKMQAIDSIKEYIKYLDDLNVDYSHIDTTDLKSIDDVEITRMRLRLLVDRFYYSGAAEEFATMFGKGLEYVFDGDTAIPVLGLKPNYKGFTRTLQNKLSIVRPETAEIMSGFVGKSQSPWMRIFLTIGPSLVMYPALNAKQPTRTGNTDNIFSIARQKEVKRADLERDLGEIKS